MLLQEFDYELPPERVATHPAQERDASRLMVLERRTGAWQHAVFSRLPELLPPHSLVVLNDTRVIPARLRGAKATGGAVELLLVRRLDHEDTGPATWVETWEALARLGHPRAGIRMRFGADLAGELVERRPGGSVVVRLEGRGAADGLTIVDRLGEVPLPPYIEAARRRQGEPESAAGRDDRERYQTVYAGPPGAVAAPTAGLHFTPRVLQALGAAGHEVVALTLHIGPGTFRPVETTDPHEHRMDAERYQIPDATAAAVEAARGAGRPVVAVGTTVVRALEASAQAAGGRVEPGPGETRLFILPGGDFHVATALLTNFHLPRSTLLMLVAAFAGLDRILVAYREAIAAGYRFYSYGDAMLIRDGLP